MAKRLLCLVLLRLKDMKHGMSAADIAKSLYELDNAYYAYEKVERTVAKMLNAGSRYRNLEHHLGSGLCFVLGTDVTEPT